MNSHVFLTQPHKYNLKFLKTVLIGGLLVFLTACGSDEQKSQPINTNSQNTTSTKTEVIQTNTSDNKTAENTDIKQTVKSEDNNVINDKTAPTLSADAGQKLYDKTCKTCHATGLLNAPKMGDKNAWQTRIAKGKETLYKHSAKGFNKMPPQAVNDVSEAQVHAAVDYMIEKSS